MYKRTLGDVSVSFVGDELCGAYKGWVVEVNTKGLDVNFTT